ncbi:MAG: hypothetical protein HY298_09085 [Verrucomicrobia bacterium]|nr:hypothetical protein [Verrucomicrobiota bacterium]
MKSVTPKIELQRSTQLRKVVFGGSHMKTNTNIIVLLASMLFNLFFLQAARAVEPPNAGLKLWLKADTGLITNVDGTANAWADQAGSALNHDGTAVGSPTLGTYNFVNGPHPVVNFDGLSTGFTLLNDADLRLTDMTIYIVVSEAASSYSRVFVSNYQPGTGWALGISDGAADYVKWYTAPPDDSMEPGGASVFNPDGTPYLLTATYASAGGVKQLFVGTNVVGSKTGVVLAYGSDTHANVGQLTDAGGQRMNGSIAELLIYSGVSDSQDAQVWAYLNEKYFGMGSGPVVINHQPVSQSVNEIIQPVTFEVGFNGAPPVSIQWYKNLGGTNTFQPIPNATNTAYTIPSVARADQGSLFQARLSNSVPSSAISSNAVLTVIVDNTPPTLVSARRAYLEPTQVSVSFDEAVSPATATVATNYSINNGLTVLQATMGLNASNVVLRFNAGIAAMSAPTLTVNHVTDLLGNSIANNSQVIVSVPASSALPPVNSDLVLWLAADKGVSTKPDGHSATNWTDLSGAPLEHSGADTQGSPQLAVANFNTGPNPVVRFDGTSGFILDNPADFNLNQFSVYVVGSVNNGVASSEFIANWAGLAFGISDGVPGRVKFVTFDGTTVHSMEPVGASLGNHVPTQLTGTFDGNKKLYVNGTLVGSETNLTVSYSSTFTVVGMLFFGGAQFLVGDIAEILVYSKVDDAQRASVENYLYQKYFAGAPTLAIARSGGNVVLTWWGGGVLQSAPAVTGPFTDIPGSTSPYTNAPSGTAQFFRIAQ